MNSKSAKLLSKLALTKKLTKNQYRKLKQNYLNLPKLHRKELKDDIKQMHNL